MRLNTTGVYSGQGSLGRYTTVADPAADAAVQEVLDLVCGELHSLLQDHLRAVVLVGGYGRGEGGMHLENGEYRLVNDLDLLVFVNRSWKAEPGIPGAVKDLARRLLPYGRGLKAIDLELTSVWRYRFLVPNTVGYYEIARGNQVVHGDPGVSACFRSLDPGRLPAYEGANYFRNRGSGLLIPALYFLTGGLHDPDKRKNFHIELHKACQAMGDALLLLARRYHYSYRERLGRFQRLDHRVLGMPDDLWDQVGPLYEWGMTQKLSPDFTWPGDKEMVEKWFAVQETFGDFFLWYESTRLGRNFGGWLAYAAHLQNYGAGEPWALKVRARLSGLGRSRNKVQDGDRITVTATTRHRLGLMILPLLLFALAPDLRVEKDCVRLAAQILGQPPAEVDIEQWQQLVGRYLLSFFPKDIVREALAPAKQRNV